VYGTSGVEQSTGMVRTECKDSKCMERAGWNTVPEWYEQSARTVSVWNERGGAQYGNGTNRVQGQ
jgi:hypothetical protein